MRAFRLPLSICVLCALVLLGTPPSAAFAEEEVSIVIGENTEMQDFLAVVAKTTGRPLVWNPADKNIRGRTLKGGITLKAPRGELFSLVRGLLTFYELVFIPIGPKGYEVMLVVDARQTSSILKLKPVPVTLTDENAATYETRDGLFVTTTIHVEHMDDLRNARNALTRIVTGQNIGNVTEVPAAKAFVVTDFAPNVVAIYRLLRKMDVPQVRPSTAGGKTVAVTLVHAGATELAHTLARHFASTQVAGGRTPPSPRVSAPRITADARTNRILVTGDEHEIATVKEAIALLDVAVPAPQVSAHLIRLTHAGSDEAAGAITALIRSSPTLWAATGSRPSVISHSRANALLVSASAEDLSKIKALIAEMDTKQD